MRHTNLGDVLLAIGAAVSMLILLMTILALIVSVLIGAADWVH